MLTLDNTTGLMVPTPATTRKPGGLYAAANLLDLPAHGNLGDSGMHFESAATLDIKVIDETEQDCISTAASVADGFTFIGTQNFMLYAAVKCTGFGNTIEDFASEASARLEQAEERGVEKWLWDNVLTKDALMAPAGLSPKRAAGVLETQMGRKYVAQPTMHFGHDLALDLRDDHVFRDDLTTNGSRVVNGDGYFANLANDGNPLPDESRNLFLTGQVTIWRGATFVKPAFEQTTNQLFAVAVRPFAIAIDGPIMGAEVALNQ